MDDRITKLASLLVQYPDDTPGACERWKRYLQGNLNFVGVEFPDVNIAGADLSELDLSGATFRRTQLNSTNFTKTKLNGVLFDEAEMSNINFTNAEMRKTTFVHGQLSSAKFLKVLLQNVSFEKTNLNNANFCNTKLDGVEFDEVTAQNTNFSNAKLGDAKFEGGNLSKAIFKEAECQGANFIKTHLPGANFTNAKFNSAQFIEVEARGTQFSGVEMRDAKFEGGDLSGAIFHNAELQGAKFLGANLSRANFTMADISAANMSPSKVDSGTLFENMRGVKGCQIDRYTLESLKENGGLTIGDRREMNIRDDVAKLRYAFSGFQQWLHLLAFIMFVFPYLWFIAKSWAVARFRGDGQSGIALWEAIARFIVTGGDGWREGWSLNIYSFGPFVFMFFYNVLRLLMLLKTKRLELQESTDGFRAMFKLQGAWYFWYQAARFGFWVNLAVVAVHTYHFLQMMVPIG